MLRSDGPSPAGVLAASFARAFSFLITTGQVVFGLVENLTMQAVDAFVRVDLARRVDRLHRALVGAGLAGISAFVIALQPVEHPEPRRDRQRRAQRAEIAAVEALDEQPGASSAAA
jgi:hypothetical protein